MKFKLSQQEKKDLQEKKSTVAQSEKGEGATEKISPKKK